MLQPDQTLKGNVFKREKPKPSDYQHNRHSDTRHPEIPAENECDIVKYVFIISLSS